MRNTICFDSLVKLVGHDPVSNISTLIEQVLNFLSVFGSFFDLELLFIKPISLASAKQRAGRAGRTGPGECWRLSGESFWTECSETDKLITDIAFRLPYSSEVAPPDSQISLSRNVSALRAVEKHPPEILRVPLEDIVLKVLQLNLGSPEEFLATCLDCPNVQSIRC